MEKCDLAIYIALGEEFDTLYQCLPSDSSLQSFEDSDSGLTLFKLAIQSEVSDTSWDVLIVPAGAMGTDNAAANVSNIIQKYNPSNIFSLGISGAMDDDLRLGDVVVPKQIDGYQSNASVTDKADGSGHQYNLSGDVFRADQELLNRVKFLKYTAPGVVKNLYEQSTACAEELLRDELSELADRGLTRTTCTIHSEEKNLASGNNVGKSSDFAKWLKARDRKLVAIDMEAAGVFTAGSKQKNCRMLAIRGISDFADDRKQQLEGRFGTRIRQLAMANASRLALALVTADCIQPGFGRVIPKVLSSTEELQAQIKTAVTEGVGSPTGWFTNWNTTLAEPSEPPTHWLLDSVFVNADIYQEILGDLQENARAGISGFVGMGGVGKTYTAMKVAQTLHKDHAWHVVWVSLLQQGTDEALDQIAERFRLNFVQNLKTAEKVAAIQQLAEHAHKQFGQILFVLDNAEQFGRLELLIDALKKSAILVTSRERICPTKVPYRNIQPFSGQAALDFCRKFLAHFHFGNDLNAQDQQDLEELSRLLGGHPLGMRLALARFVAKTKLERQVERRFLRLIKELKQHGLATLASKSSLSDTPDEQLLHTNIESTFSWTYDDLFEQEDNENAIAAYLLLPILAILGTASVDRPRIEHGLKSLCRVLAKPTDETDYRLSDDNAEEDWAKLIQRLESEQISIIWLQVLLKLTQQPDLLDSALTLLNERALCESQGGFEGPFSIHPLIREFALAHRAKHVPMPDTPRLCPDGPSNEALFRMALDVFDIKGDADNMLDLLPRLTGHRALAEQAVNKILNAHRHFYFSLETGSWDRLRQQLSKALELVTELKLDQLTCRVSFELGELLDRMEEESGIPMLRSGILLAAEGIDREKFGSIPDIPYLYPDYFNQAGELGKSKPNIAWTLAYLACYELEQPDMEASQRAAFEVVRTLSTSKRRNYRDARMGILWDIANHYLFDITRQIGLSAISGDFSGNALHDLANWLQMAIELGNQDQAISQALNLHQQLLNQSNSRLDPSANQHFQRALASCELATGQLSISEFEQCIQEIQLVVLQ